MRLPAFSAPVNHLLRTNSWAMERLAPYAGRVACFDNGPFTVMMTVTTGGEITDAAQDAVADVTVRATPGLMLRIMARDASAWGEVKVEGDAEFAAAINHVVRNLRWDIEEDLSRVVGDIAAHRMVETGRRLDHWGRQSADNLARSFTEYWTEEQPLIASKHEVETFVRDVDVLRDDLARMEKRVEGLEKVGE
jgi:ubiquinone biosynthesis protein UbiJ